MLIVKQKQYLLRQYANYLFSLLGSMTKEIRVSNNDIEIKTTSNNLRSLLFFLKCHTLAQYKQLIDIACSDVPGKTYRFTITYLLHSLVYNARVMITVKTNEVISLPSIIQLYESAGWLEREVYDLFGIFFHEHTDLRRILTDYGFSGHPLRKDFPLTGFIEIYYNDSTKRMAYEKPELAQEFRTFTIQNP
jgi:NADH dehydrogenase (ubiquinone) Fe-S protein 3